MPELHPRETPRRPLTGMLRLGRPGHVWIARCWGCQRKTLLPVDEILARFGDATPIHVVLFRLRCATCGRTGAQIYLAELPDPERAPMPHQRQAAAGSE